MRLFVYGTLMRGRIANGMLAALPGARRVGRATLRGRLYDLGAYPGVVLGGARGRDARVRGELWELAYSRHAMRTLDAYEGCSPHRPSESLFVRRRVRIRTSRGTTTAWVYALPRPRPNARLVPTGEWHPR